MYKIRNARKDKDDGKIIHEFDDKPDVIYRDIRCGLVWPYQRYPGYWCAIGERDYQNQFRKYPLTQLAEGESKSLTKLFHQMTDALIMFRGGGIFTDLSQEFEGYREIFLDYAGENNLRDLYLREAPWIQSFQFGIELVQEWVRDKALEIPKDTVLARQLGSIPEAALEENSEIEYYAINALRFVLGSFKKYDTQPEDLPPLETLFNSRDEYLQWAWGY